MSTEILHKVTKKAVVPQLRFPEFEEEWKGMKLGKLGTFLGGGTPNTTNEYYWKGNTPWISSSDIFEDDLHSINISRYLTDIAIKESATKIIPKNSILLVSRVGVGKLAINKIELCTSQDFSNFIPSNDNSFFIGYYLISKKNILINFSQGTSIKGFTTSDVKTLSINIPSLPEQQKIASFLSAVDEKIQQLTRKKELLEQYKKGVMQQLFSGKLRFKDDKGKDFPEWEEKKLGDLVTLMQSGISRMLSDTDIGLPIIRSNNLQNGRIDITEIKYWFEIDNQGANLDNYVLSEGDLLVNFINSIAQIGKVAMFSDVLKRKTIFTTNLLRLRFKDLITSHFMMNYFHLKKYEDFIQSITKPAVNQASFTTKDFKTFIVNLPSLPEQKKIADFLSSIDVKIENANQQVNQAQQFKKGLLQQLFV